MTQPCTEDIEKVARLFLRWKKSPRLFAQEALGVSLEPWQADGFQAIENGEKRIAIRSGHGVGKTTFDAILILWFGLTHEGAKIPATAPTAHQLNDVLWSEIGKWHRALPDFFRSRIEVKAERVEFYGTKSAAYARTSRKEQPEALQGFHADHLLFLIDEASGIDESIFETARGALSTPGAIQVMTGNPTRGTGYFHSAFHKNRAQWWTRRVGCAESSRVSPGYIQEMARDYGAESDIYRVRVLGEFPRADADGVISLELVEAAKHRDIQPPPVWPLWGLDVARFGDDATALCKRRGGVVTEKVKTWRNKDTMQTVGLVKAEWDSTPHAERPAEILVDVIGIGSGVADRLAEIGLPARGINVAEAPAIDDGKYLRLRDELWFKAREWFAGRACSIPDDEALIGELTGPRYRIESSGKLRVEPKDEMKKRGLASPDRADAFCLTFAGDANSSMSDRSRKLDYSQINKRII